MKKPVLKRPARSIRPREKLLVIAAVTICALGAYALTRVTAREDELKLFSDELTRLGSEVGASKVPRRMGGEMEEAQEALAAAQEALDATQKALAEHTGNRVNAGSADAVESVMLEVTTVAARFGVDVRQAEPYAGQVSGMLASQVPGAAKGADLKEINPVQPLAGRPLRKLTLAGRYGEMKDFLGALNAMRNTVRVLNFSVRLEGNAKSGGTQSPLLAAEVVILL